LNSVELLDVNQDDHLDFILGNWGKNSRFSATEKYPVSLYINDFDSNGHDDYVFTYYENGKQYPLALKHEMVAQIPEFKKRFIQYQDYAGKTLQEIFTPDQITNSYVNQIYNQETSVVFNMGDGSYKVQPLSYKAQLSPVFSIAIDDFDRDSLTDVFMAGNFSGVKPEEGRYDVNTGILLDPYNLEEVMSLPKETGLNIHGDVRKAGVIRSINGKKFLIIAKNNDELEFYEY